MLAVFVYQVVMGKREQAARLRRMNRPLERPSAWVEVGEPEPAYDLVTGEVRERIPTVATPRGLYVTPDGAKL